MILQCKKTYYLEHYSTKSEKMFLKNHSYEAFQSKTQLPCSVSVKTPNCLKDLNIIEVISDDNRRIMFNSEYDVEYYLPWYKKYFYTESEVRKMKLKRLNSTLRKIVTFFKTKVTF